MNRLEEFQAIVGDLSADLWSCVLDLHMLNTGSSEGSMADYDTLRRAVQMRLDRWEASESPFDAAVKAVIETVLAEKAWFQR